MFLLDYFLHLSQYEPKPIFQCNHSEFRINILSLQALVTTTHEASQQIGPSNEIVIYQSEDGKTQLGFDVGQTACYSNTSSRAMPRTNAYACSRNFRNMKQILHWIVSPLIIWDIYYYDKKSSYELDVMKIYNSLWAGTFLILWGTAVLLILLSHSWHIALSYVLGLLFVVLAFAYP